MVTGFCQRAVAPQASSPFPQLGRTAHSAVIFKGFFAFHIHQLNISQAIVIVYTPKWLPLRSAWWVWRGAALVSLSAALFQHHLNVFQFATQRSVFVSCRLGLNHVWNIPKKQDPESLTLPPLKMASDGRNLEKSYKYPLSATVNLHAIVVVYLYMSSPFTI